MQTDVYINAPSSRLVFPLSIAQKRRESDIGKKHRPRARATGVVNSKNGIVDRHYWRRHSLTITGSFVGRKVDYMKAYDYNSAGRVREIAVQFVRERRICRGNFLPSPFF